MSRRRTSTGATSIASRTTRGLTSTFMRRSVKTNEFKTHESVSDRESRHFQRGGDFGKKAPPAPGPWLDCVYSIYRRIHHIWVQLLHVERERTAIFAQARSVAAERRGWCKPGRVRRAPVFLDLSLPTAQEMELARPARQFPALARFPYHYGHGGAVGNRLALLFQIRGDSRDGFLDYDRGHAQRVCRTIPVCANPAKLECCGAFRPGDQGDGGQTLWGRGRKTWPNRRRPRRIVGLAFVRAGRSNIDCDRPLVDDLARSQAAVPSFTSAPAGRGFRSVDHLTLWNSAHAQFPTRVGHSDGAEAGIAVQARPIPLPNQAGFFPLARCPPSV